MLTASVPKLLIQKLYLSGSFLLRPELSKISRLHSQAKLQKLSTLPSGVTKEQERLLKVYSFFCRPLVLSKVVWPSILQNATCSVHPLLLLPTSRAQMSGGGGKP